MSNASKPDYIAYNVVEGSDDKKIWNRVGAAWTHGDGDGINIVLDSLPLSGKISLRVPKSDDDK